MHILSFIRKARINFNRVLRLRYHTNTVDRTKDHLNAGQKARMLPDKWLANLHFTREAIIEKRDGAKWR